VNHPSTPTSGLRVAAAQACPVAGDITANVATTEGLTNQ
jgi:predicted amidohydrolase